MALQSVPTALCDISISHSGRNDVVSHFGQSAIKKWQRYFLQKHYLLC